MLENGNGVANGYFEAMLPARSKPNQHSNASEVLMFIREKYERRRFAAKPGQAPPPSQPAQLQQAASSVTPKPRKKLPTLASAPAASSPAVVSAPASSDPLINF
jgi:hypothetical protein